MSVLVCGECGVSPIEASPACSQPHETAGRELVSTKPAAKSQFILPETVPTEKPKKAPRWRGKTVVYINKDGDPYKVFHRNASETEAWEHPYGVKCEEACLRS